MFNNFFYCDLLKLRQYLHRPYLVLWLNLNCVLCVWFCNVFNHSFSDLLKLRQYLLWFYLVLWNSPQCHLQVILWLQSLHQKVTILPPVKTSLVKVIFWPAFISELNPPGGAEVKNLLNSSLYRNLLDLIFWLRSILLCSHNLFPNLLKSKFLIEICFIWNRFK